MLAYPGNIFIFKVHPSNFFFHVRLVKKIP
uniref:Uncharacterized protein n=1 Tax=Arundo donax TaxID=35708 RepID=A0A0A9A2E7_ARUDO